MKQKGKYIGIDIGSKKIGIAVSDDEGMIAFPRMIKKVDRHTVRELIEFYRHENAVGVVMGESKNSKGEDNAIMELIHEYKAMLEFEDIPVILEKEFLTSQYARIDQTFAGLSHKRKENQKGRKPTHDQVDDKAAAIILQRFLDRK